MMPSILPTSPTPSVEASTTPTVTATPTPAGPPPDYSHVYSILGLLAAGVTLLVAVLAFLLVGLPKLQARRKELLAAQEEARLRAARIAEKKPHDEKEWAKLHAEAEELIEGLRGYRTSIPLLLEMPLMIDVNCPPVGRAYNAMEAVRRRINEPMPPLDLKDSVSETDFSLRVSKLRASLSEAEDYARTKGIKTMSREARASFKRAQRLWALAENEAATPSERASAYERVRVELSEHVTLPEAAVKVLEQKASLLAITAN